MITLYIAKKLVMKGKKILLHIFMHKLCNMSDITKSELLLKIKISENPIFHAISR